MWHTMTAAPVAKVTWNMNDLSLLRHKFLLGCVNARDSRKLGPIFKVPERKSKFISITPQLYARPGEDFSDHANVHKLLGHMVDSGVAAGYEEEEDEKEGGNREAGRRWGRPRKGTSINMTSSTYLLMLIFWNVKKEPKICRCHTKEVPGTDSKQARAVRRLGMLKLDYQLSANACEKEGIVDSERN